MEMSVAYLADTVASMAENGWTLESDEEYVVVEGVLSSMITKHRLTQGEDRVLSIEAIAYADGTESYFMAIERYGYITSTSFPLDSWKYRDNRVEFKYYTHPETGLGISFIVWYEDPPTEPEG